MLGRALVWLATLLGFVVGLLVVLALFGILHLYSTPSASMEPTLLCARPGPGCSASENDRVAVLKYVGFAPGRGDLVAFHTPPSAVTRCGAGGTFVKRIIGVPGDRVGEAAGAIFVNGARIIEPYVPAAERDSQSFSAIAVPPGSYYVVGDNRRSSCDSRAWGFVPRAVDRRPRRGDLLAVAPDRGPLASGKIRYHCRGLRALLAMSTIIQDIERRQLREVPQFKAGDTVRVHFRVIEGSRQRIQVFEGIVIKRQGAGARETFTVRKNSFGVGVERTFPLHSPKIDKIEVQQIGDVNRAKLYYLRGKVGKKARVRELRQS